MARRSTTSDTFNAVAEPRRRRILNLLMAGERSVNGVVRRLRFTQPQVSKHLRVLRQVGLVKVRGVGKQRMYRLSGEGLKPIHDWVCTFERFWSESFDRLDEYLKGMQEEEKADERKD